MNEEKVDKKEDKTEANEQEENVEISDDMLSDVAGGEFWDTIRYVAEKVKRGVDT